MDIIKYSFYNNCCHRHNHEILGVRHVAYNNFEAAVVKHWYNDKYLGEKYLKDSRKVCPLIQC